MLFYARELFKEKGVKKKGMKGSGLLHLKCQREGEIFPVRDRDPRNFECPIGIITYEGCVYPL